MRNAFLITGLPRSRTAWMAAAAMTNPHTICYHEPLKWLDSWQDAVPAIWNNPQSRYRSIGIADHGLGFHIRELLERCEGLRVLVIHRPIEEVRESLARLDIPESNFCDVLFSRLSVSHPDVKHVVYHQLRLTHVVCALMDWLAQSSRPAWDAGKVGHLQEMNIQAPTGAVAERAFRRRRNGEITRLLGEDVVKLLGIKENISA